MPLTAVEGVVKNGKIRLSEDITLPENTRVYVIVADQPLSKIPRIGSPHFVDPAQAAQFRKQVVELPNNAHNGGIHRIVVAKSPRFILALR